jgi:hypothetical protein
MTIIPDEGEEEDGKEIKNPVESRVTAELRGAAVFSVSRHFSFYRSTGIFI